MLKLTGNVGKSIIVDAIKQYNNARVYSYDKELIPILESYHVNSDECSVKEFCQFVYNDICGLGDEYLPINMVVIYTNLSDIKDVGLIENYAHTLEYNHMVGIVVVVSR